jgi:hypothetical protein
MPIPVPYTEIVPLKLSEYEKIRDEGLLNPVINADLILEGCSVISFKEFSDTERQFRDYMDGGWLVEVDTRDIMNNNLANLVIHLNLMSML